MTRYWHRQHTVRPQSTGTGDTQCARKVGAVSWGWSWGVKAGGRVAVVKGDFIDSVLEMHMRFAVVTSACRLHRYAVMGQLPSVT